MSTQLEQLREMSCVVADTASFDEIQEYSPQDSTTNPSLVLQAVKLPGYMHLMDRAVEMAKEQGLSLADQVEWASDQVILLFGVEILKRIKGRVSTEIDARLSFDTDGTVEKGRELIMRYSDLGIDSERVLLKIAATWEGIRAAEILEAEGIHTNLTLIFSVVQAVASAEAGATLVSPFVGRILDWYRKNAGREYTGAEDPGVINVTQLYRIFKKRGMKTQVMGASFRNKEEILELAGCDLLTISPKLMGELAACTDQVVRKLSPGGGGCGSCAGCPCARRADGSFGSIIEQSFRWQLNEDAMATEKLAEGIRKFAQDNCTLQAMLQTMLEK